MRVLRDVMAAQGYLVVKVLEAAGHNSEDERVWDANFTEGFVKGERLSPAPARRPPAA